MLGYFVRKIIGTKNEREVKRLRPLVDGINALEQGLQSRSDDELRDMTAAWKAELSAIDDKAALAARLDELLPEAFAMVKNACRRLTERRTEVIVRNHPIVWEMIPFDVQLIGGMALHSGKIAEMATGEGKTLVATLPAFLNALTGRGVHVVTVNDYLASRDSEWMGAIYRFLGLTVGCIQHNQSPDVRRAQYACDITYGTNSEFGFDYLRDNGMATTHAEQVQREHYFAIVDEVDSILIDEARTPLIISGPAVVHTDNKIYDDFKPAIQRIVDAQRRLCERFASEAESLIRKLHPEDGSNPADKDELERQIGILLFRVKQGQPRLPAFLRLLESAENLRLMNKAELSLHADQTKKLLYGEKEELFFAIDEKGHDSDLTEKGRQILRPDDPDAFMLPDIGTRFHEIDSQPELEARQRLELKQAAQKEFESRAQKIHVISQLLKAFCLFEKDVHYVVHENKVIIVDEHTGRALPGRRWSDGLHQAVEAKEGVEIERETQTYATITIQNYFRLYTKLAGMTGTAETEAQEFLDIYHLGVLVIPTNKPCLRKDAHDTVYKTKREKWDAVIREISEVHQQGRPILVGTVSVEASEHLARLLKKAGIVHSVLNAKFHEQEAEIVSRAGQRGSVTIATNMAGRGTDIKLGPGVPEIGGLHVVSTERHEARRIDRQLRGRCARQGDPGSSHFFLSLEDDLMRLFGSDRIIRYMEKMGLEEGQELEHPLLNRSIEQAQKRVEQHHFQIRKRTLEFDDVMNRHREVIYGFRNDIIRSDDVRDRLMDILEEVVVDKVRQFTDDGDELDSWNLRSLVDWANLTFPLGLPEEEVLTAARSGTETPLPQSLFDGLSAHQFAVATFICDAVRRAYDLKISVENPDALKTVERYTMLSAIDRQWQEHLYNMDSLRVSISLRAYGQRDPLIEYKSEAFKLFEELMVNVKSEICRNIFLSASSLMAFQNFLRKLPQKTLHAEVSAFGPAPSPAAQISPEERERGAAVVDEVADEVSRSTKPQQRPGPKVGRNDPCPCGSGKKFKQCCGR
ncbi:MAG: preprotein translocase subunit SecA [Verrucomicrobiae bacterium]|nr:preprotein translocase subunit SecA [Verrucomicrobiae bacterium]